MELYLATDNGLVMGQYEEGWAGRTRQALAGQEVTSVIAREGVILAGTKEGVQRSDDGGENWRPVNQGLELPHVRWLAYHPAISDLEFAGTEPAGIFVSTDGAESWRQAPEVARMRGEFEWFLPYSPEAGCVRGFAFQGDRVYGAVEVGGLLASDDRGRSWALVPGSDGIPRFGRPQKDYIHPDVHSVNVHPEAKEMVYCPTGGGFYISQDSGRSWSLRYDCYCRAVWVDSADPQHLVLGPATSVSRDGRIEETHDGGQSWTSIQQGSEAPWPSHMVERFVEIGGDGTGPYLYAVLSNGHLLVSEIGQWHWQRIFTDTPKINDVTTMN